MSKLINTASFKYRENTQSAWQSLVLTGKVSALGKLVNVVMQAPVQAVTANGIYTFVLAGITEDHVVGNWGMFSDSDCTVPIPENAPTCDLEITTTANSWAVSVANFSSTFYLRPTFVLKQN